MKDYYDFTNSYEATFVNIPYKNVELAQLNSINFFVNEKCKSLLEFDEAFFRYGMVNDVSVMQLVLNKSFIERFEQKNFKIGFDFKFNKSCGVGMSDGIMFLPDNIRNTVANQEIACKEISMYCFNEHNNLYEKKEKYEQLGYEFSLWNSDCFETCIYMFSKIIPDEENKTELVSSPFFVEDIRDVKIVVEKI